MVKKGPDRKQFDGDRNRQWRPIAIKALAQRPFHTILLLFLPAAVMLSVFIGVYIAFVQRDSTLRVVLFSSLCRRLGRLPQTNSFPLLFPPDYPR